MLIARYLSKELVQGLAAILLVLLVITLSNMYVHYLSISASSEVFNNTVLKYMATLLPGYLALLFPISFFLAILWVYGKLFADNELMIILACGMTWRKLLRMTLTPALYITFIVGLFSLFLVPAMTHYQQDLSSQASNYRNNLSLIKPGRIFSTDGGQQVVYIGQSSLAQGVISDLFIYRNVDGVPQIILSPSGHQEIDPKTGASYIVLTNGHEYKGNIDKLNFQIVKFASFSQQIQNVGSATPNTIDVNNLSTWQLLQDRKLADWAELEWRLAAPVSVIVLACLGLAISYVPPRKGRFSKLFPALLLFIIYFNLLSVSRSWVEQGDLSPWIGLWWVHIVFFIAAILMIYYRDGKLQWRWSK